MTNSTLQKQFIQSGAAFAAIAVVAGALGSHLLANTLGETDKNTYEIAVRYQLIHSLALISLGLGLRRINDNIAKFCFAFFVIGIILFSGSLFAMSTSVVWAHARIKWLGAVAPFGGASFVAAWMLLALKGYKPSSTQSESAKKVMEMQRRK